MTKQYDGARYKEEYKDEYGETQTRRGYDYARARKLGERKNFANVVMNDLRRLAGAKEFLDTRISSAISGTRKSKAKKKVRGY